MNKDTVTCLIKDDISTLFLLYRKLLSLDCEVVGLQTAYDRRNQRFVINQNLTKHFPKLACLGPIPVYEDYVTMANFPHDIDINDYKNNVINIDIMEHLKTKHLNDIYPKQTTIYKPKLYVDEARFEQVAASIDYDKLNIVINMFDPVYDKDFGSIYDVIYCLTMLQKEFKIPIQVYNAGLIHEAFVERVSLFIKEELSSVEGVSLINIAGPDLTTQLSHMLHSDLFISGSYGLGFLAYMSRSPSFIIYPYNMLELKGHTIEPDRNTEFWYAETTDDMVLSDLPKAIKIAKSTYDKNRTSKQFQHLLYVSAEENL